MAEEKLPDYYSLIGVSAEASPEELRRVYGEQVRDAMSEPERFAALNEAFETLKDPARRAAYDRQRRLQAASMPEGTRVINENNATIAAPMPAARVAPASERTVMVSGVNLPTVCAINLTPCPLLTKQILPDEGFCPECGLMLGVTLGEMPTGKPRPKLVDESGRDFLLRTGENVVGREGADVMLPDKTVSRRHARIVVEESGAVWVEDTGSTNGTKRASAPLSAGQRASLSDGMAVQFGAIKLVAVIPADLDMAALPAPEAGTEDDAPLTALEAPGGASGARLVGADGKPTILASARTTFGRKPENNVVLIGDSYVSGSHAIIVYENEKFILTDIGSSNGTQVNGKRLEVNNPTVLSDGDTVIMGKTTFTFRGPS